MIVDIYRSMTANEKFLTVPAGTDLETIGLGHSRSSDYRELSLFKGNVGFYLDDPRAGMDTGMILKDIEKHGFAAHETAISASSEMSWVRAASYGAVS